MHLNINRFLIIVLLVFIQIHMVHACRFNVRETGFVDLGDERYFLVGFINDQTPAGISKDFTDVTKRMLSGSNISFELINLDTQRNHPATQYLSKNVQLKMPQAMLISPEGQSLNLEIERKETRFRKSFENELSEILSSPFRRKLQNQLIERYGVILVIESSDRAANEKAIMAAREAVENVTKKMDLMPKVIKIPPKVMVIKYEDRIKETLLFWILGLEADNLTKPHAVIFYGRARWLGPLFRGEEITRTNLSEILFVVGADCECGLDKNWLRGTMLPLGWDKKAQKDITDNLGFDPENPMIKIEVSRIMRTEHYLGSQGIPSPGIVEKHDSTDAPRQGIDYDDEPGKKGAGTEPEPSERTDGSILPKSVIFTAGFLVLLLIVGVIFILRRSGRKS